MSTATFVIVGAGMAGAKAAATLREQGFDGRVVLIGSEPHHPYERPPLSKQYLRGESASGDALVHPRAFYAEQEIELLLDSPVGAIDPVAATVTLDGDRAIGFDRLLLATGAEPRRLQIAGADLERIHYLRTLDDCDLLRAGLVGGGRVAVVGAGWIGSEVAASARQLGLEVVLIDPQALPNERIFGAEIGGFYRDLHARHGVEFLLGDGVEAFEGDTAVRGVRTTSGRLVECDLAVVGIGVTPRVELAAAAGLVIENGVVVDDALQTSAPNVYAAGDIANAWHPFLGRRVRVEHWANALDQGPAAARSMLGQKVSDDRIPYFFSDQYEAGMEYSGYATEWDEVVVRGDLEGGEFIAFWQQAGRVVAGMNVNVWDVNDQVQALIRSRRPIDAGALADPDTPLADLAGGSSPATA